jgi:hypothetical protein
VRKGFETVTTSGNQCDGCSVLGETTRCRLADATARSGDEGD